MPKHPGSAPPPVSASVSAPASAAASAPASAAVEPESLAELRGDCARMAPHWAVRDGDLAPVPEPVPPSRIHGVRVPPSAARLLDGMSEYGD
ncbi:hypothetical protein AB0C51_20180 [Streptomyces pathocidini]|uniref:Uncharacterized protein n=1 Tax=Streptomyces pathocidini TaxID=1650571 RepID=A0ABW7UUN8_9ACTN|nr:hypothetical protein [Streptomyces pathocidini]